MFNIAITDFNIIVADNTRELVLNELQRVLGGLPAGVTVVGITNMNPFTGGPDSSFSVILRNFDDPDQHEEVVQIKTMLRLGIEESKEAQPVVETPPPPYIARNDVQGQH